MLVRDGCTTPALSLANSMDSSEVRSVSFQKQGKDYKVVDKDWKRVRNQLVSMRVNGGFPYITVNDGDYMRNGELYLKHWYEGNELDVKYLEKVMPYIYQLWGRGVHLETKIEEKPILYTFDSKGIYKKYL